MRKTLITIAFWMALSTLAMGQGANLFDDSFLHTIHFNSLDTSLIDGSKVYQQVDMVFDGNAVDSIGIKEKGNISNGVPNLKVPFKVKTNKYVSGRKYDGIKEFTLHNNFQDPTMMREKLTYELCAQLGLFALRTAYAKVYVNGTYFGLYTIVEGKDEMFKHRFDHRDADAIESLDFGGMCYLGANEADYDFDRNGGLPYYQLENGDDMTAWPLFVDMMDKTNNTPDATYLNVAGNSLNLRDFFVYQALNVYLLNFDSYIQFRGNQIYAFDTTNQIWQVIPWDFNASIGLWASTPANMYPLVPGAISNGCIASRLNTIPALNSHYMDAMCNMANDLCDTATIFNRIDFLANQITAAVHDDYRKTYTNAEFDQTIGYGNFTIDFIDFEGLKTFFASRSAFINQELVAANYSCTATAVEEELERLEFEVYPNPAGNYFKVNADLPIEKVLVSDLTGKVLRSLEGEITEVRISDLARGIYLVTVQAGGRQFTKRLAKQ